jgi:hypothetical protein
MGYRVPSSSEISSAVRRALQFVGDGLTDLSTKVDKNYFKCTSTTRPSSPTAGDKIFETNTLRTLQWDGTGWVILAEPINLWTPTITGITIGNGSWNWAEYHRSDGYCDFSARLITGTTTTFAGTRLLFTLPINAARPTQTGQFGVGYYDNGGSWYPGVASLTGSVSNIYLDCQNSAGTYTIVNAVTGVAPLNWSIGSGHAIDVSGRYRMATRYS